VNVYLVNLVQISQLQLADVCSSFQQHGFAGQLKQLNTGHDCADSFSQMKGVPCDRLACYLTRRVLRMQMLNITGIAGWKSKTFVSGSLWLLDIVAENWSFEHWRFLRFCIRHSKDIWIRLHFVLPIKRMIESLWQLTLAIVIYCLYVIYRLFDRIKHNLNLYLYVRYQFCVNFYFYVNLTK